MSEDNKELQSEEWVCRVFFASWCKPCQRIKPKWENEIKPMIEQNNIKIIEYDYDDGESKELM